ncbi:hypothetical protein D9615_010238 [Tricholomella constricta]|uniref:Protein kinase domain-containing protein n=1 Tax=Tricholomella constricta TaxID=117010 RepID=A0A8H5GRH5_9AGAR|nr:hypothetical protein D9615_010238 [Tricholomella constricta]
MPFSAAKVHRVQYAFVQKQSDGTFEVDSRDYTIKIAGTEVLADLYETIMKDVDHRESILLWLPKVPIEMSARELDTLLKDSTLDDHATIAERDQTIDAIMVPGDRTLTRTTCKHCGVSHRTSVKFMLSPLYNSYNLILGAEFQALLIVNNETEERHSQSLTDVINPDVQAATTQAPAIELFHPVFAEFFARADDNTTDIPDTVVCGTASLMRSVSAISTTESTRTDSRKSLSTILGQSSWQTRTWTGAAETTALALLEERGELGVGGCEPSVQGSFSYAKFWAANDHRRVRDNCCCPSFIIALAGPWLAILGAVTTSKVIVQRLTDYLWLGNSRVDDDTHILRIARTLDALRLSLQSLETFYEYLEDTPAPQGCLHPRFFPSVNSYLSGNTTVTFSYKEPLERDDTCVTFLATLNLPDARPVVVKFVPRYGVAVHRLLADRDLAPELIYHGPIGGASVSYNGLMMVVMEYIQGKSLAGYFDSGPIPQDVLAAVKEGMSAIHAGGFVYGDLRRPNVVIADVADGSTEAGLGGRVRFIDFDWAGKAGDVRYPFHLSDSVCMPSGASEYELIDKEHDIKMLAAL